MAVVLRFRSEDLLQCRFGISPLCETTDALRAFGWPSRAAYHASWHRRVRPQVPSLGIGPLLAILAVRGYQPDFLNPAPRGPVVDMAAQLAQVRATPPATVAAELAQCRQAGDSGRDAWRKHPELGGDPAAVRDLLAGMLERAWSALVEPWWPRIRDVLDADITYRARRLADAGLAATLAELDDHVSWEAGVLRFAVPGEVDLDASGRELVLIPSVFAWPSAGISFDPPSIVYAARGIFGLWGPETGSDQDLERLVGRARATLLRALEEPASTTGLAARAGLAVSSVSEHVAILRANGLVSTTRTGRFLVHQRTELGTALCAPAGGLPARPGRQENNLHLCMLQISMLR